MTATHGRICYLEIPALDVGRSATFYTTAFGWKVRIRGDGARAFDDASGAVSGSWVAGRVPMKEAGIVTYVQVDEIDATLTTVVGAGGSMVTPRTDTGDGRSWYAVIRDPAGNLVGLYQQLPQ
jgi:hypothetical protein